MTIARVAVFWLLACAVAGCSVFTHTVHSPPRTITPAKTSVQKLFDLYDTNDDSQFSRSELEAGLRKDFAVADKKHDKRLDADEARAINQERWDADASMASPLVDWNQDGFIDFTEFGATARSLFAQYDLDGDGIVTESEVMRVARPRRKRVPKP